MAEFYLSADTDCGKRLLIAPLTSGRLARCIDPPQHTDGYFLTEEVIGDPVGAVTILAKIQDQDAAVRLGQMFGMS